MSGYVEITKNADPDKYKCSRHNIGFDSCSKFLFSNENMEKNVSKKKHFVIKNYALCNISKDFTIDKMKKKTYKKHVVEQLKGVIIFFSVDVNLINNNDILDNINIS